MKNRNFAVFIVKCTALVFVMALYPHHFLLAQRNQGGSALYLTDEKIIGATKGRQRSDNAVREYVFNLTKEADKLLDKRFGSVVDKPITPPSGNKHDYMSLSPYWWPDPSKPDGLPYIQKDGQRNPEANTITDDKNYEKFISGVKTLSWAYYFTDNKAYAKKAVELIRFWFLDSATYMLPNLNFAQIKRGRDELNNPGIIETNTITEIFDEITLLKNSGYWTGNDESGIKQWFGKYLNWLLTSKNGIAESQAQNNHGTWIASQKVVISLYLGKTDITKQLINDLYPRLAWQLESDGSQPIELKRTLPLEYTTFNLKAWFIIANAAEKVGIDLWNYKTPNGASLKTAIDWLMPYAVGDKTLEANQLRPFKPKVVYDLLLTAYSKYHDPVYKSNADRIENSADLVSKLIYK